MDRLLRGKRMVEMHTVVKRSVRTSVESYSLKALEDFHQYRPFSASLWRAGKS